GRSDHLRRRARRAAGAPGRNRQRGRARFHRDRDERADAPVEPGGGPARELPAAGRSAGRCGRGDRVPGLRRGRRPALPGAAWWGPEHRGAVTAMTNQLPARPAEQVKDLADVPSFPAVYAAALTPRRGRETSRRDPLVPGGTYAVRSEEHTSELQSRFDLVCRLLLE